MLYTIKQTYSKADGDGDRHVLTYRGITVASALASWLWGWSAPEMFDSSPDPVATLSPGCTPARVPSDPGRGDWRHAHCAGSRA
jgi:hypothetical protein